MKNEGNNESRVFDVVVTEDGSLQGDKEYLGIDLAQLRKIGSECDEVRHDFGIYRDIYITEITHPKNPKEFEIDDGNLYPL